MTSESKNVSAERPPALVPKRNDPMSSFTDPQVFDQLWRGATALAKSQLVPQHFRGKPEDCFVGLHMAHRLNADPIMVLQSLYVVHGTPGWSAKFVIAQANMSNAFSGRIKWRTKGSGKTLAVTAYATLAETGDEVAETVTMEMAQAEGWTKNNKYASLPALMLKYRSATFLVRLYAPEVLMGVPVVEEAIEIAASDELTATIADAPTGADALRAALTVVEGDVASPAEGDLPEGAVIDPATGEVLEDLPY